MFMDINYLGDFGLFGGCFSRIGECGGLFWFGSNISIGGVLQSSHDCCWIFGALGLDGGLREHDMILILPLIPIILFTILCLNVCVI